MNYLKMIYCKNFPLTFDFFFKFQKTKKIKKIKTQIQAKLCRIYVNYLHFRETKHNIQKKKQLEKWRIIEWFFLCYQGKSEKPTYSRRKPETKTLTPPPLASIFGEVQTGIGCVEMDKYCMAIKLDHRSIDKNSDECVQDVPECSDLCDTS